MPSFSDLHSDYPLNFTLFGWLNMDGLKRRFGAAIPPSDSVNFHSVIGVEMRFVSWGLAHALPLYSPDVPDRDGNPNRTLPETRTHLTPQYCSPEGNPATNRSTHTLAQAAPSVAQTRYSCLSMDGLPQFVFLICEGRREQIAWRAAPRCAISWGEQNGNHIDKEHIMFQSRGPVSFHPLFTAEDIGLRKEASVEHAIQVFLYIGEAMASRWLQMPKGVLLLQAVPNNPQSGAIYLYDRERQIFYFVVFEHGRDDSLTAEEFEQLVTEYDLLFWASNPDVLRGSVSPAMA